jgi:phosphoribosylaminoimidazolecarboxamide formyltransferase/IMP cyclohydrolase
MIERVLISVSDKTGLEELVEALGQLGVEIVASSGTASKVKALGYGKVREVSEYTGHPESPGGLLKTLHPKIHGGLLLNRDNPDHRDYMDKQGILPFDLVVVNLYPFEETVKGGATLLEAAEEIDIGGPAMIRAAAKGALLYNKIAVVVDPSQYVDLISSLQENRGDIPSKLKRRLAEEAFRRTAEYDAAICRYLEKVRR